MSPLKYYIVSFFVIITIMLSLNVSASNFWYYCSDNGYNFVLQ